MHLADCSIHEPVQSLVVLGWLAHRAAVPQSQPYSFARPMKSMNLNLEVEQEEDGRWLAEVLELPGAMAYGASADEAMVKAEALAFRALAEQLEHGEVSPLSITLSVPAAA
jgi:predicted RNase H-like HicB family nuclease